MIEDINVFYSVSSESIQNHQVRSHEIISTTRTNTNRIKRGQRLKFQNLRRISDRSQCLISRIVKSNSVRVELDLLNLTNVCTVGFQDRSCTVVTDDCRDTRNYFVVFAPWSRIDTRLIGPTGNGSCLILRNEHFQHYKFEHLVSH